MWFLIALLLAMLGMDAQSVGLIPPSSAVKIDGRVYYCQDIDETSPAWEACK